MKTAIFFLSLLFALTLHAQQPGTYQKSPVVKQVKSNNKEGKYDKSRDLLLKTFKSAPEAHDDAELLHYATIVYYELAKQENRKIYLGTKPDTVAYFGNVLNVYTYALQCDSIDQRPDRKGRVHPRFSSSLSNKMMSLRNNLRSGGKFFFKQHKYAEAYPYFDTYLKTISHPLLCKAKNDKLYATTDLDADSIEMGQAALISAFGAQRYADAVAWSPLAISDTTNRDVMLEITAKSHEKLGNTEGFEQTLLKGCVLYPTNDYFLATIVSLYNGREDYAHTLEMLDHAISVTPSNRQLWSLKGKTQLCLHQPDSAFQSFTRALAIEPDDAESHAAIGSIWLDRAHQYYATADLSLRSPNLRANRKHLNDLYTHAMQAFEQARRFDRENATLWLDGLRETYFKLNRGKELNELDNLTIRNL